MNKKEIIKRLANTRLDSHERETLSQLLHYMTVEDVDTTISKGMYTNGLRTKSSTPKTTHTRPKKSNRTHNKPG
jgi:hypothetical protein